jgi:beta-glucosidase
VVCIVKQNTEVISTLCEANAVKPGNGFLRMVNRGGQPVLEEVPTATKDLKEQILDQLPAPMPLKEEPFTFGDILLGRCTAEEFVGQLTDEELDDITHGYGPMNDPSGPSGNAGGIGGVTERLKSRGIPTIITTDGPSGIRVRMVCSLLPCGTALASSFDPEAVEQLYTLLGKEMLIRGSDVLLGPGMNIHRDPLCGRNFEYYSEDPFLTGKIAAAMVRGIQSQGVSACPKHFACNNQERNRQRNDSRVSQRAQREIYLKAFQMVVKEADPWCLMTSYNLVNGVWSHYHYELVTEILRQEWGYQGLVITDWWMQEGASPEFPNIRNDAYRIRAQVDVLMPGEIKNRTLLESLRDPVGVTRAEAQRCALNVIKFILRMQKLTQE